ncbi:MAG: type VI secretion system baseplate subunit TssE [Motiliproteus sp.]
MLFWKTFLAGERYDDDHSALVASVQYQLTRLLESEAPLVDLPPKLGQVEHSNMRFGLDCLQSIRSQQDPQQLTHRIEEWIKAFEPRLSSVTVELFEPEEQSNALHFSLLANLTTAQGTRTLEFDSKINRADQKLDIKGQEFV